MSQAEVVEDPITQALARRRAQVMAEEAWTEEARVERERLKALVASPPSLEPGYLVALLRATWQRLPDDLTLVGWESPTAESEEQQTNEILAIGGAVADVLSLYEEGQAGKGGQP